METKRTYTYDFTDAYDLSSIDLRTAAIRGCLHDAIEDEDGSLLTPHGTTMQCGVITVENEANAAEFVVLWETDGYRIGIAWGSYADWGDFHYAGNGNDTPEFQTELEQCIDEYLNDADAFIARN